MEFRNVTKAFGNKRIVHGIDLTLDDGQFTVLVGPSGCGKTTTLRMLAGLESVSEGSILIDGEDVTAREPRDRDVSMVFQNYALYPHLSVLENIAFPIMARRGNRKDAERRAREAADLLGLVDHLGQKPGQLSGGQQQRVAIGRAIVRRPRVYLFDEPLSNLDARLRLQMRSEILRLQRRLGVTAVYVTHDQEEAMTMSDTMVVMHDGVIAQRGAPDEVYAAPADLFVAGFVGSPQMNLVDGSVNGGVFESSWGRVTVNGVADRAAVLGVRPELVSVTPDFSDACVARVELVENLGPRAILTLGNSRGDRLTAVMETAGLPSAREGDEVGVSFFQQGLHVFDRTSEQRLLTT